MNRRAFFLGLSSLAVASQAPASSLPAEIPVYPAVHPNGTRTMKVFWEVLADRYADLGLRSRFNGRISASTEDLVRECRIAFHDVTGHGFPLILRDAEGDLIVHGPDFDLKREPFGEEDWISLHLTITKDLVASWHEDQYTPARDLEEFIPLCLHLPQASA